MFWFRSMHAPRCIECQRCRTAHENTCSTSQLPGRGGRHACAALPLRCLAIKYNDDPGVQHCLQISPRVCFNLPCRSRCSQLSASERFRCSRPGCRSHTEVTSQFLGFFCTVDCFCQIKQTIRGICRLGVCNKVDVQKNTHITSSDRQDSLNTNALHSYFERDDVWNIQRQEICCMCPEFPFL